MKNINYTEHEKSGGYKLEYIAVEELEKKLIDNIQNNTHNQTIVEEMLAALESSDLLSGKLIDKVWEPIKNINLGYMNKK